MKYLTVATFALVLAQLSWAKNAKNIEDSKRKPAATGDLICQHAQMEKLDMLEFDMKNACDTNKPFSTFSMKVNGGDQLSYCCISR